MRLPRSLSGAELADLLRRTYDYSLTRQRSSHMRLTSAFMGYEHHVSVPRHNPLRIGTLSGIEPPVGDVAEYLQIDRDELVRQLFHQ